MDKVSGPAGLPSLRSALTLSTAAPDEVIVSAVWGAAGLGDGLIIRYNMSGILYARLRYGLMAAAFRILPTLIGNR